jgi:broad specificity phosphatase PhoE
MLKQIFLVRHAQSEEDIDPNIRNGVHDSRIAITSTGKSQVANIAKILNPKISGYKHIKIVTSPSNRAYQTMFLFCSYFPAISFEVVRERCIKNLNWGNVDETTIKEVEKERYRIGVLYFQFPEGDNTPKLVKNIEKYVARLIRDGRDEAYPECVIIFTHGFALRVTAKALLNISDDEFRYLSNPPNCYVATVNITKSGITLEEPLPKIKFKI